MFKKTKQKTQKNTITSNSVSNQTKLDKDLKIHKKQSKVNHITCPKIIAELEKAINKK